MARIHDTHLSYEWLEPPFDEFLSVTADCWIRFTGFEQVQMPWLKFSLDCYLIADDPEDFFGSGDDHLFTFETVILPQTFSLPQEHVTFQTYIHSDTLDEDSDVWQGGFDDIYARFWLVNLRTYVFDVEDSPVIEWLF